MDKHIRKTKNPKKPPLQVMYGMSKKQQRIFTTNNIGIHGEHVLTEEDLSHLEGYKQSKPVRIGNSAHEQLQLDIYGALLGML